MSDNPYEAPRGGASAHRERQWLRKTLFWYPGLALLLTGIAVGFYTIMGAVEFYGSRPPDALDGIGEIVLRLMAVGASTLVLIGVGLMWLARRRKPTP